MSENIKKRDIISEQVFNKESYVGASLINPEMDSPGDSDDYLAEEYMMGVNYMPDEKNEFEGEPEEDIPAADQKSTAPSEIPADPPSEAQFPNHIPDRLPENARVVSSGMSMPISDIDAPTETH